MGQHIYRKGLLAPFLCRGLIKDVQLPDGQVGLRLPRADEVTDAEIEAISAFSSSSPLQCFLRIVHYSLFDVSLLIQL